MGNWFSETPWPPIIVLATAAGAGVAMFLSTQRAKYLAAVLPFVLLSPVIYVIEQRILTERERVENAVYGVTSAFERRDQPETLKYFSAQDRLVRGLVSEAMRIVTVIGKLNVTDVAITMQNRDSRAVSHFRANGTIKTSELGDVGHQASRWELTWQKEGGDWRIIDVRRLDPISGEQMYVFEASERSRN